MPLTEPVLVTDSFEQWRQKTNSVIDSTNDIINNVAIADLITIIAPLNDGDILVYNSVDSVFNNVTFDGVAQAWASANSIRPFSRTKEFYNATHHNLV